MTLLQLKYFIMLANELHYTRAAQKLYITQPNLSHAISELETELGAALFIREKRKIRLSDCGEAFLSYAQRALTILDQGISLVDAMTNEQNNTVRLGHVYSLSHTFVPNLISSFYQIPGSSDAHLTLCHHEHRILMDKLRSGDLDLVISSNFEEDIPFEPIVEQRLYVIASLEHPLSQKIQVTLADLDNVPFISFSKNAGLAGYIDSLFEENGLRLNKVMEAYDCNAAITYVTLNRGISIIPGIPSIQASNFAILKLADRVLTRKLYLSWNTTASRSRMADKLREHILSLKKDAL